MARKYGMRSGYVEAINIRSGTVTIPSGSTSATVSFDEAMENVPAVTLTPAQAGSDDPHVPADTTYETGFTATVGTDNGEEVFHYIAVDESRY